MKNVRITVCTLVFTSFCALWQKHLSEIEQLGRKPQKKTRRGKSTKSALASVPGVFSAAQKESRNTSKKENSMPLIKKAPAIVTLEVKVEEPVKQLLEDYAHFIESSPDHVVNSVIKKNLWRDQEYRKWREQHRPQPVEGPKGAAAGRG